MLRRLGIRGKVLAALSVPVLVLFLLAGLISMQSVDEARTARTVTSMLGVLQSSRVVVTALEAEQLAGVPYSNKDGSLDVRSAVETTRATTDEAITGLNRTIAEIDFDTLDPAVFGVVRAATGLLDTVGDVRGRVDSQNVPTASIVENYGRLIESTAEFPANVADQLDDRRLAAIVSAHATVTVTGAAYAKEQVRGAAILSGDREPSEVLKFANEFPTTDLTHDHAAEAVRVLALGEGIAVPPLGASWDGSQAYSGYRALVATGQAQNFGFVTAENWSQKAAEEIAGFDEVQSKLRQAANTRATQVASAALRTSIITILATVLAVVVSIAVALTIARQIINPLRRLTEAAAMVRDELPRLVDQVAIPGQGPDLRLTRIPVTSRDEIGQLAAAFNEVNTTTISVAQEQAALRGAIAEMFVNVARRDQILLNRQLSFIDALERSEEDPKTLADLFRLDHLATRMRRNAESLLVLAGIETGRRLRDTLALSDVIRTASSEIEHYERVQLDLPVDPMMLGHTALPAAHMMAELLENATVFSDPGTPVQVSTGVDETNVIITILDQGLGMTPHEFAEANSKIRATSASDVLGSTRLGMFVVGRIASRLGASVELSLGPDGTGTLATIYMPKVLFVDTASLPITAPSRHPAALESFVLPDEAAEVVHDTAFAPMPEHVQDVAAGALGSAENPVEAVDLGALTDGTTGLGLPKRRAPHGDDAAHSPAAPVGSLRDADDAAAAPSIPLAPRPEALAGASVASAEVWSPPVIQNAAPLTARRPADLPDAPSGLPTRGATSGLPAREPSTATGGLPARSPGGPGLPTRLPAASAFPTRQADAPVSSGDVVNPEGRSAMFGSFRSRRAELAAAAIHVDSGDGKTEGLIDPSGPDGADRLAASASSFFGRTPASTPPVDETPTFVIPALVEDDEEYLGAATSAAHVAEAAPVAQVVPERVAAPEPAPVAPPRRRARHALPGPEDLEPAARTGAVPIVPVTWEGQPQAPAAEVVPPVTWEGQPQAPAAWSEEPAAPVTWEGQPQEPAAWTDPASAGEWQQDVPLSPPVWETPESQGWAAPETEPQAAVWQAPQVNEWADGEQSVPAPWPPPSLPAAEPVGLDQLPPDPFAGQVLPTVGHPETQLAQDFSELVHGDAPERPAKKGWRAMFGRKRGDVEVPPAQAPQVSESAPADLGYVDGLPSVAPVRQSAWGSTDLGAHTFEPPVPQESEVPAAQEPAFQAPVFEPPTFEPPTFEPLASGPDEFGGAPAVPSFPAPSAQAPSGAPVLDWQAPVAASSSEWQAPAAAALADEAAASTWAPTPAWSVRDAPAAPPLGAPRGSGAAAPQATFTPQPAFQPQTTFTPSGAFDDEVTNMLAQRADLAQQALAELSQLSSYRPKAASGAAPSTLVRRTPGNIPAAPAIELPASGQRTERDANQVRSLLSSFQSGTSRGRKATDGPEPETGPTGPQDPGGELLAGHEDGPDGGHGEPVTTPDTDLNQRSTSW